MQTVRPGAVCAVGEYMACFSTDNSLCKHLKVNWLHITTTLHYNVGHSIIVPSNQHHWVMQNWSLAVLVFRSLPGTRLLHSERSSVYYTERTGEAWERG